MTQGFDEYWDKENVRFDDGYHKHKETYELGAASRQAEIDLLEKETIETQCFLNRQNCIKQAEINELKRELDILQGMHNAVSLTAGELIDERDELQKRINLALSAVWNDELSHTVIDILRGGSNEG